MMLDAEAELWVDIVLGAEAQLTVSAETLSAPLLPSDAAAETLAAMMLAEVVMRVPGGRVPDELIGLTDVLETFPMAEERLELPCASITEISTTQLSFDPTVIEQTHNEQTDLVAEGVLWSGSFQVDLFARTPLERKAMKRAFWQLFARRSQREGSRGNAVRIARAPEQLLPESLRGRGAVSFIRFTLEELPRDMGPAATGGPRSGEWRAMARVTWDAHAVSATHVDVIPDSPTELLSWPDF